MSFVRTDAAEVVLETLLASICYIFFFFLLSVWIKFSIDDVPKTVLLGCEIRENGRSESQNWRRLVN